MRGPGSHPRPPEVGDGIFRLGTKWVNFYLVEEEGQFTVVDAGYPGYFGQLESALVSLGACLDAVLGVLVTHHHVDHAGTAQRLRSLANARVFVGTGDEAKVGGEKRSHPPKGFYRHVWRPSMVAYLGHTVRAGGARYRPVSSFQTLQQDRRLDLPGSPEVIHTPGHTAGHYSVAMRERGVLFSGDAMVNFDYATGRRGVGLHRFNEDRGAARNSLARFESSDAKVVLFGHGDPWTQGVKSALEIVHAREA